MPDPSVLQPSGPIYQPAYHLPHMPSVTHVPTMYKHPHFNPPAMQYQSQQKSNSGNKNCNESSQESVQSPSLPKFYSPAKINGTSEPKEEKKEEVKKVTPVEKIERVPTPSSTVVATTVTSVVTTTATATDNNSTNNSTSTTSVTSTVTTTVMSSNNNNNNNYNNLNSLAQSKRSDNSKVVESGTVLSVPPYPMTNFGYEKPADPRLLQSIQSEEVLRTCQNVSNVLLQIPKYQEKLLNFSNDIKNSAYRYINNCSANESITRCEPKVLNVPDLSNRIKQESEVLETANDVTSLLDLAEKKRKRKREKSSSKNFSSDSEDEDETRDVDLWIIKGPPSKLQYSEQKLSFLAIFGLTTRSIRNGVFL